MSKTPKAQETQKTSKKVSQAERPALRGLDLGLNLSSGLKGKKLIRVKGARVHNLKNIDVDIPRDSLVVLTGLSGSGKSSLAFDTIYAEGQRRYVESLSAYARQFLGLMDKPDVDQIDGLSPAISIDQKSTSHNPRSTVGTMTEIYDYLRLLYARLGTPHDPITGDKITAQSASQIVERVKKLPSGTKIMILAPIIRDQKGEHKGVLVRLSRQGYSRIRVDGNLLTGPEAEKINLEKQKKHSIEAVLDRITLDADLDSSRLSGSIEAALKLGEGLVLIHQLENNKEEQYSEKLVSPSTGLAFPALEPRLFSFNSPHGACPVCTGLGTKLEVDPDLIIPNKKLSIAQGAVRPWSRMLYGSWIYRTLEAVAKETKFNLNTPVKDLTQAQMDLILHGSKSAKSILKSEIEYEGIIPNLERRYQNSESDYVRKDIEQYMRVLPCPACNGQRLKPEVLAVTIEDKNIAQVSSLSIKDALDFFTEYQNQVLKRGSTVFGSKEFKVAVPVLKEVVQRLKFLSDVGLDYLTLDCSGNTLSGGESQRIRLATQISSSLVGVIYILDEPSIGLHQRDNTKLINTLIKLRDLGNSVLVVEHDTDTMLAADYLIDIGPGAGEHGGRVIAAGTPAEVMANKNSLTGRFLSGQEKIYCPKKHRESNGKYLEIVDAREHNLKHVTVKIPLGQLVAVTGVSGSGKSTLMIDILATALSQHFYGSKKAPGLHEEIRGLEHLDKVINIDQSPIGRTPRSNPATYTGLFDPIRDLFSSLPEAKIRGYGPGRFSFNVKGGRCEACEGDGVLKVEMNFLPDVYVECEECHGKRYNQQTLEVLYHGKSVSDILAMTVEEAAKFFEAIPQIHAKLTTLLEVGLGYIKLGQAANTLSGGEAQRVKLATELTRRATGKTLYILDEPTTGLHFADINKLLHVLHRLVDKGNSIIIIEHNLDVIRACDHVIDIGPEGGSGGGEVVAEGTPEDIAKVSRSWTGKYLKQFFEK